MLSLTPRSIILFVLPFFLASCAAMPTSGPSTRAIESANTSELLEGIVIQNVDTNLVLALTEKKKMPLFSELFLEESDFSYVANPGDFLVVTIWESYPQLLFGGAGIDLATGTLSSGKAEVLPSQMVLEDGRITVPFIGDVKVQGRTIRQIEQDITRRLEGKANSPQVMVQFSKNNTSEVTVLGDFRSNTVIPLTPKREKLLDVIAKAGGAAESLKHTAVQFTRDNISTTLPIQTIIQDPNQNIELAPGDVITALYQPKSYTIMGAVSQPKETNFETQGISLAEAIMRSGGLSDSKANPSGVFVFRFEEDFINTPETIGDVSLYTENAPVPTIYRFDYADPASFFISQNFMIEDKDIVYVSNATVVALEKFLALIGHVASPAIDGVDVFNTLDLIQNR